VFTGGLTASQVDWKEGPESSHFLSIPVQFAQQKLQGQLGVLSVNVHNMVNVGKREFAA
jgi:hypothetical protein